MPAINSTIQELIPCRYRGWTDLAINGSFWVGAALGAGGSLLLLDPHLFAADIGWQPLFVIGAALSLVIFVMRLWLPKSPRWLLTHGRAEKRHVIEGIERRFEASGGRVPAGMPARDPLPGPPHWPGRGHPQPLLGASPPGAGGAQPDGCPGILLQRHLLHLCPRADGFLRRPRRRVGWYILPFAAGNFLGPLLLGHFFDTVGRKPMIAGTYILSGVLLAVSDLFQQGELSAAGQTVAG